MSTQQQPPINLEAIKLLRGAHAKREKGVCLMEAVAWFANEPHSAHPQCASPALTSFGIALNDSFPADQRQKLKDCIPLLVGTRNAELEQKRVYFLATQAIKVFTPIALRAAARAMPETLKEHAAKMTAEAVKLEALHDIDSSTAADAAAAATAAAAARAADAAAYAYAAAAEVYDKAIKVFKQAIAIK
jgi:hypothetical protein